MKKRYLLIVAIVLPFLGLLSTPAAVNAYQELTDTPQPTATITAPPGYNPVINPTQNYGNLDCPEDGSNPVGWGTVTPSSAWLLLCSHCVSSSDWGTSTAAPTGTPNPTFVSMTQIACQTATAGGTPCAPSTATATITPTATISPTPTFQNGMECHHLEGATCWTGEVQYYEFTLQKTGFGNGNNFEMFNVHFPDTWSQAMVFFQYDLTTSWVDAHGSYLPYVKQDEWMGYHYNNQGTWLGGFPATGGGCVAGTSGSCVWTDSGNYTLVMPPSGGMDFSVWWQNTNVDWPAGSTIVSGTVYISVVGFPTTPTPTPTVTGTPSTGLGYCQTVSSEESGFSWTGISYGQEYCIDIGPYDGFDFNGLTANPIGALPWIAHICFQDVSFGELTVFDVNVSLEAMLYILGVVAIIRNLFVS